MKKLISILILLNGALVLFAQNLEVKYSAVLRQELSEEDKKFLLEDNEYGREQIRMNEEPDPATYILLISDKESSFNYQEKISNEQDEDKPVIVHAPAGFGTTYKNLEDHTIRQDFSVYGKKYFSVDPVKEFNWNISKEKKELLGFEVRKATAEDDDFIYTVWYAPKINNSTGPSNFWGLPGLILDAEQKHKMAPVTIKYYAESLQQLKSAPKLTIPDKGEQIKADDVHRLFDEANKQREEMYRSSQGVDKD